MLAYILHYCNLQALIHKYICTWKVVALPYII